MNTRKQLPDGIDRKRIIQIARRCGKTAAVQAFLEVHPGYAVYPVTTEEIKSTMQT